VEAEIPHLAATVRRVAFGNDCNACKRAVLTGSDKHDFVSIHRRMSDRPRVPSRHPPMYFSRDFRPVRLRNIAAP
jgi:hypothetical protein